MAIRGIRRRPTHEYHLVFSSGASAERDRHHANRCPFVLPSKSAELSLVRSE